MKFYVAFHGINQLTSSILYNWLEERGHEPWRGIRRDLDREGGPMVVNLDEEDAVIFKLKFGNLIIPEPPYNKRYLESHTKMAKFKRAYMAAVRPLFVFVYELLYRVKR